MDGAHGCFLDSLKELIHILSDKLLWVCPLRDTFTKTHRGLIVTSRILLVTGGSRGIGAATCLLAAQQGWQVAVNYTHNAQAAQEVVAHIKSAGGQALAIQADVADEAQVLRMYETIDQQMGRITGLVNNAGVVDVTARLEDMSVARLKRMFDVNVIGSMVVAREAVRRMSTKHGGAGGSIVNLSSAAARLGSPNMYLDYASAKGAIDVFTIGLAKEVAAEGIRVNAVRPGLIETEIHASGGLPNRVKELQHLVPMQRGGSAMEVAQSIVWLLSDAASYTTMSLLDVSGGR
jgi:NAD(P)-dependent dehydrogenase (short-subunit alcohol dehydrogenase family)